MLTRNTISNAAGASHYFSAQDDYYTKEAGGIWMGKGAKRLGLHGLVHPKDFSALLDGKLPDGRRILESYDRSKGQKRHGWDFTFSAPKSVSMQALIGGDRRILEAHREAVAEGLMLLEEHAIARKKVDGVSHRETTRNLVAAAFEHELSRAKDPQLHTHVVVMNMTQRRDHQWRALSNEELFKRIKLAGAGYRARLAAKLQEIGYAIRRTDASGGFELAHIDREQIQVFSDRSRRIEEVLRKRGKARSDASTLEKQIATLVTRPPKEPLTEWERHALMQHWKEKSRAANISYSSGIRSRSQGEREASNHARASLEFAISHLTERQSVMPDSMLVTTAMRHGVGRTTYRELRLELKRMVSDRVLLQERPLYRGADEDSAAAARSRLDLEQLVVREHGTPYGIAVQAVTDRIAQGRFVEVEARYTTMAALRTERAILRMELDGRERVPPVMSASNAEHALIRTDLTPQQRAAARLLLTTTNRIVGIQGSAGVGKSHLLKSATDIAENQGYTTVVLAPYANQVKRLQEDGLPAATLATFLASKEKNIGQRSIIVIDEAGLVPSREMEAALEMADRHGARIVLTGDVQQLKAVEAGRPFAQLQNAGMATAVMDEIQRQKSAQLKPAVELAAKGHAAESLRRIADQVREIAEPSARRAEIATVYATLSQEERARTLVVSGTNEARVDLNSRIRRTLGVEGTGSEFNTLLRKDLTQAERRHAPSFSIGDIVQPEKGYTAVGLQRGELYRVDDIELNNRIALVSETGERVSIDPRRHAHLSVYELARAEFAAGDWARITRNDPALDVANGARVRVIEAAPHRLSIETEKGRRIELDGHQPLHLEHAYATTVHSAQGLSLDRVILDLDTRSLTTGKDLYYVAISRARYNAEIYTNSRAELPAAISRENVKTAAMDIRREPQLAAMRA